MTDKKLSKTLVVLVLLVVVLSVVLAWKVYESNNPASPQKQAENTAPTNSEGGVGKTTDAQEANVGIDITQTKEEA